MNKPKHSYAQLINSHLPVIALILAIIVGAIIMAVCDYNPVEAYSAIFKGAFGGKTEISLTLVQATPLIFSGLAYTIAVKANIINLGVEGQLYMGSLGAAIVALAPLPFPGVIRATLAILGGIVFGSLYAGLVGLMKVKFHSNEVIATMMLNSIAVYLVDYMVTNPLTETGKSLPQTAKFDKTIWLFKLVNGTQLTVAILLAVVSCIIIKILFDRTNLGYEIKCAGLNQEASKAAGIRLGSVVIIAMLISGGIGGMLGACHVLGVDHRLISGFSSGYGFDGIAVAALAAGNPLMVVISGIIFGALRAGCQVLNRTTGIPTEFVDVIQALIILFVAAPLLIKSVMNTDERKVTHLSKTGGTQNE